MSGYFHTVRDMEKLEQTLLFHVLGSLMAISIWLRASKVKVSLGLSYARWMMACSERSQFFVRMIQNFSQ
jgi:hypothetical protein